YAVDLGSKLVVLSDDKQEKLSANGVEEQDITLGVRPEHITLEDDGIEAVVDVHELMGSSIHLHINALGHDVVLIVSAMNMTGEEVAALTMGATVKFGFTGNVCHVFSKETGINLEA
ncbi:MAG: TOBE domain-containing protein, partial [Lentisphaeria bacterium]|nr:TOBE domain-containing protein [Lentisphaeria bacterium]